MGRLLLGACALGFAAHAEVKVFRGFTLVDSVKGVTTPDQAMIVDNGKIRWVGSMRRLKIPERAIIEDSIRTVREAARLLGICCGWRSQGLDHHIPPRLGQRPGDDIAIAAVVARPDPHHYRPRGPACAHRIGHLRQSRQRITECAQFTRRGPTGRGFAGQSLHITYAIERFTQRCASAMTDRDW